MGHGMDDNPLELFDSEASSSRLFDSWVVTRLDGAIKREFYRLFVSEVGVDSSSSSSSSSSLSSSSCDIARVLPALCLQGRCGCNQG
jgi:hypothetical protein